MKKREKRLQLNRETLRQLDPQTLESQLEQALRQARGGAEAAPGVWTSCIEPNCCGGTTVDTV